MINPFYEGIAVVPPKIRYFDNTNNLPPIVHGLNWHSWGGPRAEATGLNEKGDPVEVALSAKRRCGLPNTAFYTRITVSGESFPLQCRMQVISATDIGKPAEDVYSLATSPSRYDISIPPKRGTISRAVWRGYGKPTMTGRGVASAWWSPYADPCANNPNGCDWRWVPALMIQSKPGYCAQLGAVVYRKVRLIAYGKGIKEGSMPIKRAARVLRKRIGKGSKHRLHYNYAEWCKRKTYPEEVWTEWR